MMTFPVLAAINMFGLVAFSGAMLLTMLLLRNPVGPNWFKSEFIAQAAALVLTAGACLAISNTVAGLIGANIHYGIAIVLTCAVLAASIYVLWKAFDIGERLKRTESGRSPFAREWRNRKCKPRPRSSSPSGLPRLSAGGNQ
jgi:hypothetical protein